ncbi:hypothetical protein [Marimonas lutisalis]|uniref:hypothetical protein n=1 Tax=Marimonas lutisalis TaxID=2545756 RepID=UPI0010F5A6A9|nr:hypothetical protein [Marimonas lutisalis]
MPKIFSDAMHSVSVEELKDEAAIKALVDQINQSWPTAERLPQLKSWIEQFLIDGGFPHPGQVVSRPSEKFPGGTATTIGWAAIKQQLEASDNVGVRDGDIPLEYLLADFYRVLVEAERAYESGDPDQIFSHAVTLGGAITQLSMRRVFLPSVTRGEKVAGGSKNAAHATNARHEEMRKTRFARLRGLMDGRNLSLSSAAEICEKEGLGSAAAIKKQWNRNKSRDT